MSDARIVDQGYRRYEGRRRGTSGAVLSLAKHSVLRALGLRRAAWTKLLPLASVVIAYLPAAVFVGVTTLIPNRARENLDLPTYHDYYGFITAAIILFVALVGPELLCTDRRNGMLGLYLASPLNRRTYLLAKVLAMVPVLSFVTFGPPLLLLVGFTAADAGPTGVGDFLVVLLRITAASVVISTIYTGLAFAVSSLTDRRAVASGGIILILLATNAATGTLVGVAGADKHLLLTNLFYVPFELVQRIFGQPGIAPEVGTPVLALAQVAWTIALGAVVWLRYESFTVTR